MVASLVIKTLSFQFGKKTDSPTNYCDSDLQNVLILHNYASSQGYYRSYIEVGPIGKFKNRGQHQQDGDDQLRDLLLHETRLCSGGSLPGEVLHRQQDDDRRAAAGDRLQRKPGGVLDTWRVSEN